MLLDVSPGSIQNVDIGMLGQAFRHAAGVRLDDVLVGY